MLGQARDVLDSFEDVQDLRNEYSNLARQVMDLKEQCAKDLAERDLANGIELSRLIHEHIQDLAARDLASRMELSRLCADLELLCGQLAAASEARRLSDEALSPDMQEIAVLYDAVLGETLHFLGASIVLVFPTDFFLIVSAGLNNGVDSSSCLDRIVRVGGIIEGMVCAV